MGMVNALAVNVFVRMVDVAWVVLRSEESVKPVVRKRCIL